METRRVSAGYTLIEVIVALLVFTVGALALAASSALIAQAMATNALRERGERIAWSRIEVIKSQCGIAESGRETVHQVESAWLVDRVARLRVNVSESVTYMSPRGARSQT
ncbi:MAG TPA: prepilin-type N-terminal cleavage/methylation domain-containing protein, partial [Gemmatimonadaceae bacterium]|nr:prepilin-type N-terminal cleavage/methylation domain-containing protein [Gemmatimonadaceae bacterium]